MLLETSGCTVYKQVLCLIQLGSTVSFLLMGNETKINSKSEDKENEKRKERIEKSVDSEKWLS